MGPEEAPLSRALQAPQQVAIGLCVISEEQTESQAWDTFSKYQARQALTGTVSGQDAPSWLSCPLFGVSMSPKPSSKQARQLVRTAAAYLALEPFPHCYGLGESSGLIWLGAGMPDPGQGAGASSLSVCRS